MSTNIGFDDSFLLQQKLDSLHFYLFKNNFGKRLGGNTYKIGIIDSEMVVYFEFMFGSDTYKICHKIEQPDKDSYFFINNKINKCYEFDELYPLLQKLSQK